MERAGARGTGCARAAVDSKQHPDAKQAALTRVNQVPSWGSRILGGVRDVGYRIHDVCLGGPRFGPRHEAGVRGHLGEKLLAHLAEIVCGYMRNDQERAAAKAALDLLTEVLPDNCLVDSDDVKTLRNILRDGLRAVHKAEMTGHELWERLHAALPGVDVVSGRSPVVRGRNPNFFPHDPYRIEWTSKPEGETWLQGVLGRFDQLGGEPQVKLVRDFGNLLLQVAPFTPQLADALAPPATRRSNRRGADDKACGSDDKSDAAPRVAAPRWPGSDAPPGAAPRLPDGKFMVGPAHGRVIGRIGDEIHVLLTQAVGVPFTVVAERENGMVEHTVPSRHLQEILDRQEDAPPLPASARPAAGEAARGGVPPLR